MGPSGAIGAHAGPRPRGAGTRAGLARISVGVYPAVALFWFGVDARAGGKLGVDCGNIWGTLRFRA
eukprot:2391490-Alexandrium_andersonii.AAC.1